MASIDEKKDIEINDNKIDEQNFILNDGENFINDGENAHEIQYTKNGKPYYYYIDKHGKKKRQMVYEKKGWHKKYDDDQKKHRLYLAYIKSGLKKVDMSKVVLSDEEKYELLVQIIEFQQSLI